MGRRWKRRKNNGHNERNGNKPGRFYSRGNSKRNSGEKKEGDGYTTCWQVNRKFEIYYAYQGLHNQYWDEESHSFRNCGTDEQKEQERKRWMDTLKCILPASFRIGTDIDPIFCERLQKELDEFVGKEMEIVIDPKGGRRSGKEEEDNNDDEKKKGAENKSEVNNAPKASPVDGETKTEADADKKESFPEEATNNEEEEAHSTSIDEKASAKETEGMIIKRLAPAHKIPYIPFAYQLSIDRRTIRRNAGLQKFHDWLKVQTDAGFITRQEAVSMIPPVVLSVEPHHQVLDMCAAPGSKTSQILEIVSQPPAVDKEPVGCVVANDSDVKRAHMLVRQLKRINSAVAFVTSCDAQFFPLLKQQVSDSSSMDNGGEGMFDRVLADVPCSGDGTMRKNPGVWKFWNSLNSLSLHPLQLAIALNGARLTKVGGYLCYSTCSMSPIENEAVVAELLRLTDGSLELVDKRPDMAGLLARPGWTTWKVLREDKRRKKAKKQKNKNNAKMNERRKQWAEKKRRVWEDQEGAKERAEGTTDNIDESKEKAGDDNIDEPKQETKDENDDKKNEQMNQPIGPFSSWDEETLKKLAEAEGLFEYKSYDQVEEKHQRRVRKSCFPPTKEEADTMGLGKCLRCLPHDMDTGGFFVALFRKVRPLSKRARERAETLDVELREDTANNQGAAGPPSKKHKKENDADSAEAAKRTEATEDADMADVVEKPNTETETKPEREDGESDNANKVVKGKPGRGKSRDDLGNENFINNDDSIWDPLIKYYGFSDDFPRQQFMSRSHGESKIMSFIGKPVKNLMDLGLQDRITVVNAGLKAFERISESEVRYRVCQEAIHYVAPYMMRRKITCDKGDFQKCLENGTICLTTLSEGLAGEIRKLSVGAFVITLRGCEGDICKKMVLVMWRCRGDSVNCFVKKAEKDGIKSKLRAY